MVRIPNDPKEIFSDFTKDYKEIFKDGLIAILLYGSGAKGEYISKKSDINFCVVLDEAGMSHVSDAIPVVAKWFKRNVSTPLFLTEHYIKRSLDVFPIEFLEMRAHHTMVYGREVFADLKFDKSLVRLQLERELKGKMLHLRQSFLGTGGKPKNIQSLIERSLTTFSAFFNAIYYLKVGESPQTKLEVMDQLEKQLQLDQKLFNELWQVKLGKKKYTANELIKLAQGYIKEIEKLSEMVDRF
jgi:predicted nucleotidyltransferase